MTGVVAPNCVLRLERNGHVVVQAKAARGVELDEEIHRDPTVDGGEFHRSHQASPHDLDRDASPFGNHILRFRGGGGFLGRLFDVIGKNRLPVPTGRRAPRPAPRRDREERSAG